MIVVSLFLLSCLLTHAHKRHNTISLSINRPQQCASPYYRGLCYHSVPRPEVVRPFYHSTTAVMTNSQASTTLNTPMASTSTLESVPPPAASSSGALGVVPEGKVAVWDDTMKMVVVKDKEDVKLQVVVL